MKCQQCGKRAYFGMSGDKKASRCSKHAMNEMIDIHHKHCSENGCNKRACFGMPNDKSASRCSEHAADGMVDIVNKHCSENECNTRPNFGMPTDKSASRCIKHATNEMININCKHCSEKGCDTQPSYGMLNDKTASRCSKHATDGMIDIKSKRCTTCNANSINQKYKPNCARCHFYLNPNDPRIRNYKTREQAFMIPLQKQFPDIILDKIISGGCSQRRPDGLFDCGSHSVIVEIDEDQHVGYNQLCDNYRTMQIFNDLGSRPVVFVRLNPDAYTTNNKHIKGTFSTSRNGELKRNNVEFNRRMTSLRDTVTTAIECVPDRLVTIIQLFFNDE